MKSMYLCEKNTVQPTAARGQGGCNVAYDDGCTISHLIFTSVSGFRISQMISPRYCTGCFLYAGQWGVNIWITVDEQREHGCINDVLQIPAIARALSLN